MSGSVSRKSTVALYDSKREKASACFRGPRGQRIRVRDRGMGTIQGASAPAERCGECTGVQSKAVGSDGLGSNFDFPTSPSCDLVIVTEPSSTALVHVMNSAGCLVIHSKCPMHTSYSCAGVGGDDHHFGIQSREESIEI